MVGAADTFRAAAVDQLATWAERAGVGIVRPEREGQDPASVAFQTVEKAKRDGTEIVIIDTAGRLHTKGGLMDELGKIQRVVEKQAPISEVLLVLDATTGQNGLAQAEAFIEHGGVTGLVLTKLDGSAKGGFVLAVQEKTGLPDQAHRPGRGHRRPHGVHAARLRAEARRLSTRRTTMAIEHDYFGLIGDYWAERKEYGDQDVEVVLDAD